MSTAHPRGNAAVSSPFGVRAAHDPHRSAVPRHLCRGEVCGTECARCHAYLTASLSIARWTTHRESRAPCRAPPMTSAMHPWAADAGPAFPVESPSPSAQVVLCTALVGKCNLAIELSTDARDQPGFARYGSPHTTKRRTRHPPHPSADTSFIGAEGVSAAKVKVFDLGDSPHVAVMRLRRYLSKEMRGAQAVFSSTRSRSIPDSRI